MASSANPVPTTDGPLTPIATEEHTLLHHPDHTTIDSPALQEAYNEEQVSSTTLPRHANPVAYHDGEYEAVAAYASVHDKAKAREELMTSDHYHNTAPHGDDDDDYYDPESVLHRTADDNFSEKGGPKRHLGHKILGWYKPVYDYKTPGLTDKQRRVPRYCGGRFRRWQFILLHLVIFFTLFMIIVIPLGYFVVIPKMVQHELNKQKMTDVDLQKMVLNNYAANSLGFAVKAALPAPHWLPVTVEIGECDIQLHERGDTKHGLVNLHIPGFKATLNKGLVFELAGTVGLDNCDPERTSDLVARFSNPAGVRDLEFQARGKFPIKMFGITWYKGLPLYLNLGKIDHADSNLKSLLQSMPSFLKSKGLNSKMKQHFRQQDLISILPGLGFPDINIQALDLVMNDKGLTIATTIFMENPTKINIAKINGAGFGLMIENNTMLNLKIRELELVPDDINKLNLVVDITFDNPAISKEKVSQTISSLLNKLLVTGDYKNLSVALIGPVQLDKCDWVSQITGPLALYLPMGDILEALKFDDIRKLLTLEGISKLAGTTKIAANVLSDQIIVPATLGLPRLLPLPPTISINYNVSAALYGADQRTLGLDLYPLTITTADDGMAISTTIVIRPENSLPAAVALATAMNPLLAAVPTNSSINMKELAFFAPAPGTAPAPFAWSKMLFQDSTIKLPLPPILCIPCLMDMLTKNGTELPFSINSLAVDQMTTAPGFSVLGSANVALPDTLPKIQADLGYAALDLAVERVPAAAVALPAGVKFIPNGQPVALNAQAVLSRDPALPAKMQSLVNSLMLNGSIPSSVGISNLMFGASQNTSFVTFSKLNIELSTASLKDLVGKTIDTLKGTLLKPGMIKPTAAEFELLTPTTANVGLAADFVNPTNISISIGHLDADVLLQDNRLISLALPPVKLTLGPGGIDIKAAVELSTGADGMDAHIAALVTEVMQSVPITALFGATNVVLSPAGTRGTASPAIIDQIKTVRINISPDIINEINPLSNPETSPIDMSALLPGDDILNQFNIDPRAASLETLPGAVLAASALVGYTNPLALAATLPFVQFTMAINDVAIVVIQIFDIKLLRGAAELGPKLVLAFDQTDGSVPDLVAEAVSEVLQGRISQKFSVYDILFGTSPQAVNNLLGKVNVDLRFITDELDVNALIQQAKGLLPFDLPMKAGDLLSAAGNLVQGTIGLETLPQKTLGVNAAVGLKLPFQLTLNIGYLASKVGINTHPLLAFLLPTGIKIIPADGTSNIALNTAIPFEDDEPAQDAVGRLVANFFQGDSLDTSIDLSGMALGSGPGDTINALSKVHLALGLDALIALDGPSDIFSLVGNVRPAIGGATLETRPGNNLGLVVDMGLALPLKIAAKVGYVGAAVGLNQNPMLNFLLPTGLVIDASGPMTALNLNTELKFVDTEATQSAVNDLVNNLIGGRHLGAVIGLGNLAIGHSQGDLITALSKVQLPADLERGMGVMGISLPFNIGSTISALHAQIHSVKLHTAPNKAMLMNAAADFDLPFPVSLRLGYAALSAEMDNFPLADAVVPAGMLIAANGPAGRAALQVPQDIRLQFTDVLGTQEALRDLVDGFIYSGNFATRAGVRNVHLGNSNSDADRLTIVSKIDIDLALKELLQAAGFSVPMSLPELSGLVSNMGTLIVATQPAKTLAINAGADFNLPLPFPVDINIGHVAVKANLDGRPDTAHPVCDVNVPSRIIMNTVAGTPRAVQVAAFLKFTDVEATRDEVNKLVQQALGTDHLDAIFGANAVQLGDSAADLVTAFNLVNIRLPIGKLVQDMGIQLPIRFGQVAGNMNLEINRVNVATAPAQTLTAGANVAFDFPLPVALSFETGFFYTGLSLDSNNLGSIRLPQKLTLSSLGDKRKVLDLNANLVFSTAEDVQQSVADLVDNALGKNRLGMTAGIAGPLFGSADTPEDRITIISKVQVELGLDDLVGGMVELPLDLSKLGSAALADGIIGLATKPQKTLGVSANVGIKLPFPLTASIGYFGAAIGVNADLGSAEMNPLASLAPLQNLNLTSPGVLALATDILFTDTDATQTDIAILVERAFNGPALNGRAGLNQIKFGASASDLYQILNKVNARLNLDQVAAMAGLKVPLQLGELAGLAKISPKDVAVVTQPGGRLDVAAQADLALPFRVQVTIGHFGTSVGVNGQRLLDLALPISVTAPATGPNVSRLNVNTTLAFNQNENLEALKTEVNNLVNHVLNGKPDPAILNIRKVQLGASTTDLITAFSKIDLPLQLDTFLPGMGIKVPLDLTGSDLVSSLSLSGDIGAKILPGKTIAFNGTAGIKLPFNVNLRAGWVGADAAVNDAPLARVGMPLTVAPAADGVVNLALNTNVIVIEDVDRTPPAVAKVVTNYFGNNKLDSTAGVSNLQFGYSQQDVIQAFSGISAALPLDALVGADRIDVGQMLAKMLSSGGLGSLRLRKLLVDFTPENLLNFALGASIPELQSAIKINANVPYLRAAALAMDKVALADATITDFALVNPFAMDFNSVIAIKDSDDLARMIAEYAMTFMKTQTFPGTLELGGVSVGASPTDAIVALSQSVIPVTLNPIIQVLLGGSSAGGESSLSIVTSATGIIIELKNALLGTVRVSVNQAMVEFMPAQTLAVQLNVGLQLELPLTLNIPYFAVNMGLDRTPFLGMEMMGLKTAAGTNGTTTADLSLAMGIKFVDSDDLANKIAAIFDAILNKQAPQGYLTLNGLGVGASKENHIQAFKKATLPIPLSYLVGMVGNTATSISLDPIAIIKAIGLRLSNIVVKTEPNRKVRFAVVAAFSSNMPITIKNLNHLALDIVIDKTPVINMIIGGINLAAGANNIPITADMEFPAGAQDVVTKLFNDIMENPQGMTQIIAVKNLVFGFSKDDAIKFLNKAAIGFPVKTLLGAAGDANTGSLIDLFLQLIGIPPGTLTPEKLMQMITIGKANFDLGQPGKVIAAVDAGIAGLPVVVDIDIGYFAADVVLNKVLLTNIELGQGLKITTNGGVISFSIDLILELNDSDEMATIIADIVNKLFGVNGGGSGTSPTIGVMKTLFGFSKSDNIDTFYGAAIVMPIESILTQVKAMIGPLITQLMNMELPAGWGLDGIDLDVASEDTLAVDVRGHSPANGQFALNLPFATLTVFIPMRDAPGDFVIPNIENFQLKDGALGGHIGVQIKRDNMIAIGLGRMLGDIVFHRPFTYSGVKLTRAGVKGISFGTKAQPFKLLSKVNVVIDIEKYVDQIWDSMNKDPVVIEDISAIMDQRGFASHVKIIQAVTLPLNIKMGMIGAKVKYAINGAQYAVSDIEVPAKSVKFGPTMIDLDLAILPDINPATGIIEPLSFSNLANMGYVTIQGSNGAVFNSLDQLAMLCPDLTFWEPLHIDLPVPVAPIQEDGLALLPLGVELWFPNQWNFGLQVGQIVIQLKNGDRDLLRVATNGAAYILNKNQGGTQKGTRNFILAVLFPMDFKEILRSILNPIGALKRFFQHLKDLFNPKAYRAHITVQDANNQEVAWFTSCMDIIFTQRFAENSLGPILGAVLTKSIVHVFGAIIKIPFLNLEKIPFIKELVDGSNDVLARVPKPIQFGGSLGSIVGAGFDNIAPLNPALFGMQPLQLPANFSALFGLNGTEPLPVLPPAAPANVTIPLPPSATPAAPAVPKPTAAPEAEPAPKPEETKAPATPATPPAGGNNNGNNAPAESPKPAAAEPAAAPAPAAAAATNAPPARVRRSATRKAKRAAHKHVKRV
ncbi:hypothetical protein PhCBS80983_g04198 [Powellomyces hirtus]|uniref:Uncharacterized protein n=1 Tax=Powellomyces hirtus TaxID=109895 RepID=A0A507DZF6_9FUNG|nr:hypothetical protein PhCBS80983_g04198 [Powellomyces hirtus]